MRKSLCIFCEPEELNQGLFGETFYYLLQLLPYLDEQKIFPQWELRTTHYGDPPDRITIPGVIDLAYTAPSGPFHRVTLAEMRRRHAHVVGNDWQALNRLWNTYFRMPSRTTEAADSVLPQGRVLGVHFRGTDKQTATWDSNPISQEQYLTLVEEFLRGRPEFDVIFAATDESTFVEKLRTAFDLPVVALGEVEFHMSATHSTPRREKADRAMLDCLLLSRCACVIETSSALPSFAKLLNPSLEIYRCAASKLFGKLYTNMPYFPVAHIPVIPIRSSAAERILRETMQMDWTGRPETALYRNPFVATPRWPLNHKIFGTAEKFRADKLLGKFIRGHY